MAAPAPLAPSYRAAPLWWDDVELPASAPAAVPADVDVVVVGGGYTGLGAALELARRGRGVAVLDAAAIASGASSRNGGMAHPGTNRELPELLGLPGGRALWDDTVEALEGLVALCGEVGVDCDWQRTGHIELAHHPRLAGHLRAVAEVYVSVGEDAAFLPRDALGAEVGSDRFAAGLLVARSAGVHPAKLAVGLARAAGDAGSALHGHTRALALERTGTGYRVTTDRGTVRCGDVVVATNGTTDRRLVPWLGRRILGIGSFMVATEPLDRDLAASLVARNRMLFDTRTFVSYWRLSPDGRRMLFGGRTSLGPTSVDQARDRLYADMVAVHPQLAGVRVDRAWGGQVGYTLDRVPHTGRDPVTGVVHAMGYCGSGIAMAVHLGRTLGRFLAGDGELSPFARRPWRPVPWAARVPPLLGAAGWWYRGRDALAR